MMIPPNHIFKNGPYIMGILNVTPDSFSDGGKYFDAESAVSRGIELIEQGADIIDVGGESTRPGALKISPKEEQKRILPVINELKQKVKFLSVDTRNPETMAAALEAGANCINDISGLSMSSKSIDVIARFQVPIFLMHMQGDPQNMQENPKYNNVVEDVFESLKARVELCKTHRIAPEMIVCDPGIGFGKTLEHNLELIKHIDRFHDLGVPVLLGTSRKSFIGKISNENDPGERLPGSLASILWGLSKGVQIFRVHDVRETRQAFDVYQAISSA